MRALITGASGFTGRHLSRYLRQLGWQVFGLGEGQPAERTDYLQADLLDGDQVSDGIRRVRPTHIVHLAARSHVVGPAEEFYRVNVVGTETLLKAVSDSGIGLEKLIVASSANIYGNSTADPIAEVEPMRPMNHYGLSKAAMELMLAKWMPALPIIVVRPFNYTGPGQSERFLFPKLVAAHHRREPVLKLGNIDVSRDLSDVRFVCEIYGKLLESDARSLAVNICSGRSVSIREALTFLASISGHSPMIEVDPDLVRPDEIKVLRGDPTRLSSIVGDIRPIPFEDTLRAMYEAFESSPK